MENLTENYKLIRQQRKTLVLTIKNGVLIVKAPLKYPVNMIEKFIAQKSNWIAKKIISQKSEIAQRRTIVIDEELMDTSKTRLAVMLAGISEQIGISYRSLTVKKSKTKWGSCNSYGDIMLNWRLYFLEKSLIEFVIVHELCHRKEMNHSPKFWALVEFYLPSYKSERKKLKSLSYYLK